MRRTTRSQIGSIWGIAIVGIIPVLLAFAGLGVDTLHFAAVQAECQRACDAGALAGAADLWEYDLDKSKPPAIAVAVAELNDCEGALIPMLPNVSVNAKVETPPSSTNGGTVRCNITLPYSNILGAMFGAQSSTINCTA